MEQGLLTAIGNSKEKTLLSAGIVQRCGLFFYPELLKKRNSDLRFENYNFGFEKIIKIHLEETALSSAPPLDSLVWASTLRYEVSVVEQQQFQLLLYFFVEFGFFFYFQIDLILS